MTLSGRPFADLICASRMARLADDARIMSTAGKDERQFDGGQEMRLVNGPPRCDVIGRGADREGWSVNVCDPDRAAIDHKSPHRKVVIEEKPAQIFRMHAVRHAR